MITDVSDVKTLMLAGKATLTIKSKKTGGRFTYRFNRPPGDDPGRCVWVRVLTGPDNENSYRYLGVLWPREMAYRAKGDEPSSQAIRWVIQTMDLQPEKLLDLVEVWHEGKCCRCGRKLTTPESIARGLGPECATR
jgi:hypothetical protein